MAESAIVLVTGKVTAPGTAAAKVQSQACLSRVKCLSHGWAEVGVGLVGPQSLEPSRAGGYRIGLPATSPPPPPQPRGNRQAGSGQPFLSASSFPHSREEGRQGPCMPWAPRAS